MALRARVVAVRTLRARGRRPSYGRMRAAAAGVVGGHRADRLRRRSTACTVRRQLRVLIGGARRPLAGMVTMDQIVVDCGEDDSVRPGDEVVLLGRQGDEVITADDWAAASGTISYEVLCGIGPQCPVCGRSRPGPGPVPPPPVRWRELRQCGVDCARLPPAPTGGPRSCSAWATRAALLFVGEGPGRDEDLAGEPFVGARASSSTG